MNVVRFWRQGCIVVLVMTALIMNFSALPAQTSLPTIRKTFATLQIDNGRMPYWRNRPIDAYDPRVTRAIIVIHGSGGNAEGYFDRINDIIPSSWGDKVMVLAPHFQEESEAGSDEYWWDGDWREGGASGGISSYTVVDVMVGLLRNDNFPNLKWIVIGGHSAGGQFSQRYAAFTDIDLQSAPNSAFVKFVPANPSSYVYLNEYRHGSNNNWIIPQECSSGDGYNEWKYGLEGLYGYTADRGPDWARTHLPQCRVELLAGEEDVLDDDGLDTDCAAMRQGENRYERAQFFNAFMDEFYSANNFSLTPVPGIGHDSAEMFASPQGINAFFFADDGPPDDGSDEPTVTLNPTADAYVKSSDASDNFGTASTLRVKQSSTIYNSYLKFVVSDLSGAVQSAKLRLRVTDDSNSGISGGSVFLVSNTYQTSSTPWTERGLTYKNAPSMSGNALSTVGEVNSGEWVEFDVTTAISGNGTFSFGLRTSASSTVRYSSKEGDDAPELVLQVSGSAQSKVEAAPLKSSTRQDLNSATQLPDRITLAPSYPNPFNAQAVIEYTLPEEAPVHLGIYNLVGQLVRQLVDETQSPGYQRVLWNGRDDHGREVGSGVYLYRLQIGTQTFVRKMTLQK